MIVLLMIIALYALSWLLTVGLIKLIALCFGFAFSWTIATGIWLIFCLLNLSFKGGSK